MPLDNDQIVEIRRLLELRKERLTKERDSAATKDSGTKKTEKKAKKATPRKKMNPLESAVTHELSEIDEALKRLADQEHRFGYCERCYM